MVRKIVIEMSGETIQRDLERYKQLAIDLGAGDAAIIPVDQVTIDERVRAKCRYPKCRYYGTNAHCPPYAMELDETRKLVQRFHFAVLFRLRVPNEVVSSKRSPEETKQLRLLLKTRNDIVSSIESEAFYDGHYLAVGFGGGPCKSMFCPEQECQALKPGQGCRAPYHARSSMESVGMDAFRMATIQGWDIYPIGKERCDAPFGSFVGIVLIC